jgi:error-prone DNA polymerase
MTAFAELVVATNFSFLRGASHPEELVARAKELGLAAIGVADRNSLAGAVRMHVAAKEAGVRLVVGARLVFSDGTPDIAVYPVDRSAYGRLARLLTLGNRRAPKGECLLSLDDFIAHGEGLLAVVLGDGVLSPEVSGIAWSRSLTPPVAPRPPSPAGGDGEVSSARGGGDAGPRSGHGALDVTLARLRETGIPAWVAVGAAYGAADRRRRRRLERLAAAQGARLLATNDVLVHAPERKRLLDVVTCVREGVTLATAGLRLAANAERHPMDGAEMARRMPEAREAIAETVAFLARARFSLDELAYEYPEEDLGGHATPQAALEALTRAGAYRRYPQGVPATVEAAIAHEFAIIAELGYARYFLTVQDIVRFARSRGILCQGRGSAANSAVCFCLGITEVDPKRGDLLFERFVSPERREPPDIDVDFEHERREEVIQYIYAKYGRERAGLAAAVITYRARMALRETAKVFGLSDDTITALAGTIWGWSTASIDAEQMAKLGLDPAAPPLSDVLSLAKDLVGFPRHLTQHTGGFVITRGRLDEVVPIGNAAMDDRTVIEWDKDDLDALGILKIDVLALGMLTCIRKALAMVEGHYGRPLEVATIPAEDPAVYDMICRADTIGVFQIESRAQMTMLPRLRPRAFYDLVIEVAIVRPGPIQGDMVHPYLRRRQGLEPVVYPSRDLEAVLGKTLGVPLFQEQAMKIAIVAAGFTPAEADKLRRAMATFRRVGTIGSFQRKMIEGMAARGYDAEFAARCFRQIEGFGEYGFPESHAASFALLVYASCWLKCHYPDVFACALLNSQPMGFYSASQIVRDAREHGVVVRPPCVNASDWDSTLEREGHAAERLAPQHREMAKDIWSSHAIRLGLRQVTGLREDDARRLVAARAGETFDSVRDVWLRAGLSPAVLERLADADAFAGLGLSRRDAVWAVKGLTGVDAQGSAAKAAPLPLFDRADDDLPAYEPNVNLPRLAPGAEVVEDYRTLRLSLKAHPAAFARAALARMGVSTAWDVTERGRAMGSTRRRPSPQGFDVDQQRSLPSPLAEERLGVRGALPEPGEKTPPHPAAPRPPSPTRGEGEPPSEGFNLAEPDAALPGPQVIPERRMQGPIAARRTPAREDMAPAGARVSSWRPLARSAPMVRVAGLVLVRQRPGSAKGVIFATLEDETGVANIIVWPKVFERYRPIVLGARFLGVRGRLQAESGVVHVVAEHLVDLTHILSRHMAAGGAARAVEALANADEVRRPQPDVREKARPKRGLVALLHEHPDLAADAAPKVLPKGRNFH